MRLSDEEFSRLSRLNEFMEYYEGLTVSETMEEIDRIYTEGSVTRSLFQQLAMHKRLMDAACSDANLPDQRRNAIIGVVTGMRETIETVILPLVAPDMRDRAKAALDGSDDYACRYGAYPQAVLMIRVGARRPSGPYEMSAVAEVLAKS